MAAVTDFATLADLAERWPGTAGDPSAAARLRDACAMVSSEMSRAGVAFDPLDESQAGAAKYVVCQMVHRALSVAGSPEGVSQRSQTAGPYTVSTTFSNPDGGLYISASERRLLGMRRMRLGSVAPRVGE